MKNFIKFILILLPWFLSSIIFKVDSTFYTSLNLPKFVPPTYFFPIVWTVLYILIAISIYIVFNTIYYKYIKSYTNVLIYNYIFNQLFTFFFFSLKNIFLGFVDIVLTFITSLFLYYETKEINEKASLFLIPYTLFTLFALILNLTIYFMNL